MPKNTKIVYCIWCTNSVTVDSKTVAALCGNCVAKLSDAPVQPKPAVVMTAEEKEAKKAAKAAKKEEKIKAKLENAKRGRGRGWHLKQLFEFEGKFFSFGKEVTEAEALKIRKKLKKEGA